MRPPPRRRSLPVLRALRATLRTGVLAWALAVAWRPAPAHAVEITGVAVNRTDDWVAVSVRLSEVLSPRVRGSLERGMPATIRVTVDLWRSRAGWFDKLKETRTSEVRVARNAWSDEYAMSRDRAAPRTFADLDAVNTDLARPMRVRLLPVARLEPGESHYALVRIEVKPLNVEDIGEVERWLSGEAKRAGKPGPGSIAKLPVSMVNVLANLSGLGDETAIQRTGMFTMDDLGGR